MSNKWKILLGVLIVSGIVFAAVETKFYGNINLQNNKVVNMGTPTSNSDGANKSYVDTQIHTRLNKQGGQLTGTLDMQTNYIIRLKKPRSGVNGKLDATPRDYVDGATNAVVNHAHAYTDTISTNLWKGVYQRLKLSGGTMTGNLGMGGYRIYNLANPVGSQDGATKSYVDDVVNNANAYQYFALKKGSAFTPLYNLDSNTNRYFDVKVVRQFTGAITCYYENINASALPMSFTSKTYKVGEAIKVPFALVPDTFSETNGTLIVKGGDGVLGNFGITAPPNGITPFTCSVSFNGNTYAPNTAVSIYNNGWDSDNKCFTFKIKNTSGRTISSPSFQFPKVSQYASPTEYSTYTLEFSGSIYSALPQSITLGGSWANNVELNCKLYILDLDVNTNGLRWQFKVSADGSDYTFGQFFLPNVE